MENIGKHEKLKTTLKLGFISVREWKIDGKHQKKRKIENIP